MEKFIISVEEAIEMLGGKESAGINEDKLRALLKADICTFGKTYKKGGESYCYSIDRLALERCKEGQQNFFK